MRNLLVLSMTAFVLTTACSGGDEGSGEDLDSGDETAIEDSSSTGDGETDSGSTADGESDTSISEDGTSGDTGGSTSDSGSAGDSSKADSTTTDSKPPTDGASGDTGGDSAGAGLPTVNIITPTAGASFPFLPSGPGADACQPISFSVSYSAPNGFNTMRWRFLTPNAGSTGGGGSATGYCNGTPAYGYFMKHSKYQGQKSGTVTFAEAMAGLYTDTTNTGRWWWCTWPGTKPAFDVSLEPLVDSNPGVPGSPGYQTLSNYCYSNTKGGTPTDVTQQWTFEVTLADLKGNTVTATRKFWIHN